MVNLAGDIVRPRHGTNSRSVDLLRRYGGATHWVLNLGAEKPSSDITYCLVDAGWHAILIEGQESFAALLRGRYADRRDVYVVSHFVEPGTFPSLVRDMVWNYERPSLIAQDWAPDLLKIDVDNGDCDFLREFFAAGHRPLVVMIDLIHAYVPAEFRMDFPFSKSWSRKTASSIPFSSLYSPQRVPRSSRAAKASDRTFSTPESSHKSQTLSKFALGGLAPRRTSTIASSGSCGGAVRCARC